MNFNNEQLIKDAVNVFNEFMGQANVDYDTSYVRYAEFGPEHVRLQSNFVKESKLYLTNVEDKLSDRYFSALAALFKKIFLEMEKTESGRPTVAIIKLSNDGAYDLIFDYGNPRALEINVLSLGQENSYFKGKSITRFR
ncbi:hypothetical protein FLL45_18475 [Aliikangiella marina]|uniref:Uncharacterized protein n=1 Tax=Aliikangiella marina TaxID=1712262 RepID=A0A545T4T9_9GAMM|nr:hypothetical protein [Aliikangiella marina]TQV72205.1 hypothetical protein FLL45_18475 [Aliikangiella marina]